jgi:hypothetical protein
MKKYFLLLALCISCISVWGQSIAPSILNAAGGSGLAGSVETDWSAAEMTLVSTTPASSSVIVTQGVLQPVHIGTAVPQQQLTLDEVQVFPNPASNVLNIRSKFQTSGKLSYTLSDVSGRAIQLQTADYTAGTQTKELSLQQLAAGSYMLYVQYTDESGQKNAVYKIQKVK